MKVVLLAGGLGTRLSEETQVRPKPMVEIGGRPILWHIMKIYSHYGFNDFIILLGYKGEVIKQYFSNYFLHNNNITIDMTNNSIEILNNSVDPWKVTLIDTGLEAMTGARIKRAQEHIGNSTFMLTYGDGLSNIDLHRLLDFHKQQRKTVTMTTVQPEGRFGVVNVHQDGNVIDFAEKPKGDGNWVNAGFFVCERGIFDFLDSGNECILEQGPLKLLTKSGGLVAFKHSGFWRPMDTLKDKVELNSLWSSGDAPWKLW